MNKKQVLWHIEALEEYSEWQNEDLKKANKGSFKRYWKTRKTKI